MKKIVLGCAAVLLSLGLLAGCNNKEEEPPITEAVSLSVSQTSVNLEPGGSAEVSYTVSPAKATVMALSDHEEYVTALAQDGTIYLEAVAAGTAIVSVGAEYEDYAPAEATITVTVSEVLEPEPVVPAVSLTLEKSTLALVLPEDNDDDNDGSEVISYTVSPTEEEGTFVDMNITSQTLATTEEPDDGDGDDGGNASPTSVKTYEAEEGSVITLEYKTVGEDPDSVQGWVVTPVAEGTAEITVTAECEGYETAEATLEVTVHEAGWEPEPITGVTLSITLKYDSQTVESIPNYVDLYILGTWKDANMESLENAELLTQGEGCVFTLTLEESLEVGEWYNYKIYAAYTEQSGQSTALDWNHCLYSSGNGYFQVTEEVTSNSTLSLVAEIEVDPANVLGDPSVGPFTSYTIHFYFTDGGSNYYTLPTYADAYLTGDLFKSGPDWTYGGETKLVAGTGTGGNTYYSYTFNEIEVGSHTLAIYFEYNENSGAEVTIPSWQHQYSSNFTYTVNSSDASSTSYDCVIAGGDPAEVIPEYNVPDTDSDTFSITIVTKDTGSNASALSALYITGGEASGDYYNYHYTMSSTSGTNYSEKGEFYYTFSNWGKQTNLEFCLHHMEGDAYWYSDIIPSTNVTAADDNYHFWTYNNGSSGTSYMGFSLENQDRMSLVGIDELILVLSFDYSSINTSSDSSSNSHNNSIAMSYSVTAVTSTN